MACPEGGECGGEVATWECGRYAWIMTVTVEEDPPNGEDSFICFFLPFVNSIWNKLSGKLLIKATKIDVGAGYMPMNS